MKLSSNRHLYEYLESLATKLRDRGAGALSESITTASRYAAGMSTEFLGESRIVLRNLAQRGSTLLSQQEQSDLSDILAQLDEALDRRGERKQGR